MSQFAHLSEIMRRSFIMAKPEQRSPDFAYIVYAFGLSLAQSLTNNFQGFPIEFEMISNPKRVLW